MYKLSALLMLFCSTLAVAQYQYDPNDFPAEVIDYTQGVIPASLHDVFYPFVPFTYPTYAFGLEEDTERRPTYLTTGDPNIGEDVNMPVVPVYGAFRWWEIVTIGNNGGKLIVKFNHHVADDKNNPYGIDFIIFGNAQQSKANNFEWKPLSDPTQVSVGSTTYYERGIVSVSQDGIKWYKFIRGISADPNIVYADSNGPYADDFAPTAGYKWDYANHCWGEELDPTKPVNPALTAASMNGKTIAQMVDAYDGSAGGTGFDIGQFDLEWIQYVRIEDNPNLSSTTEIDAVSDVSACGDYKHPFPIGDLSQDCRVNMNDFAIAAQQWVDMEIVRQIVDNWLECTWNCE
ncbi:MAG: hypothetical protein Q7T18_06135 [Sedimentisphaerales bacterium]|nr:hypothetical protein [Sedimentisphaerales bacterium]